MTVPMWIGLALWVAFLVVFLALILGRRVLAEVVARARVQLRGGAGLHEAEDVAQLEWERGEVGR